MNRLDGIVDHYVQLPPNSAPRARGVRYFVPVTLYKAYCPTRLFIPLFGRILHPQTPRSLLRIAVNFIQKLQINLHMSFFCCTFARFLCKIINKKSYIVYGL